MKRTRFLIAGILILILLPCGCSLFTPEEEVLTAPTPQAIDPGDADFSVFVSLGNSLTAGYQSGALYESAQFFSLPKLLAAAMQLASFEQPLIADPGIYDSALELGRLQAVIDDDGDVSITPIPWTAGMPEFLNAALPAPYHNLGIPGALAIDLMQATDAASSQAGDNSYFDIILRNAEINWTLLGGPAADLTALEQAILLQPSFMTVWIGTNEILGAATEGSGTPLVPAGLWEGIYNQLLATLDENLPDADEDGHTESAIVLANIPPVTAAPFFTTVPWFVIDEDQNPVDGDPATDGIQYVGLIAMDAGPGQLAAGDLVLLTLLSYDSDDPADGPDLEQGLGIPDEVLIAQIMAIGYSYEDAVALLNSPQSPFPHHGEPIPGELTLIAAESAEISLAIDDYNQAIADAGVTFGFPVVDANAVLTDLTASGYDYFGHEVMSEFVTGGAFSLDGIHPTDIGNAIIAAEFTSVINERYGSNLPEPYVRYEVGAYAPEGLALRLPPSFPNLP